MRSRKEAARVSAFEQSIKQDLFNPLPDVSKIWEAFKLEVDKLKHQGYQSICHDWWRSRYYDWIYPGHKQPSSNTEWSIAQEKHRVWPLIWQNMKGHGLLDIEPPPE